SAKRHVCGAIGDDVSPNASVSTSTRVRILDMVQTATPLMLSVTLNLPVPKLRDGTTSLVRVTKPTSPGNACGLQEKKNGTSLAATTKGSKLARYQTERRCCRANDVDRDLLSTTRPRMCRVALMPFIARVVRTRLIGT